MRKSASEATKSANNALLKELPFSDKSDFENAHRGFVEALPSAQIKSQQGNLICDPRKYSFIKERAAAPDTSILPLAQRAADLYQRPLQVADDFTKFAIKTCPT